jgi:hypothetical protein
MLLRACVWCDLACCSHITTCEPFGSFSMLPKPLRIAHNCECFLLPIRQTARSITKQLRKRSFWLPVSLLALRQAQRNHSAPPTTAPAPHVVLCTPRVGGACACVGVTRSENLYPAIIVTPNAANARSIGEENGAAAAGNAVAEWILNRMVQSVAPTDTSGWQHALCLHGYSQAITKWVLTRKSVMTTHRSSPPGCGPL